MFGKLTEKEYTIMKYIWDNPEGVTFNEVYIYANTGDSRLQRQTVNTHLHHLIEKGFVKAEGRKEGISIIRSFPVPSMTICWRNMSWSNCLTVP